MSYSDPFGLCPTSAGGDGKTDTYSDCPKGTEGYNAYQASIGNDSFGNEVAGAYHACLDNAVCKWGGIAVATYTGARLAMAAYGWLTAGAEVAGDAESAAVDANKLRHIFGNAGHNLSGLVEHFGSEESAFNAVQKATQGAAGRLSDVFETTVNVGGQDVTVRGRLIDGVVRIGTFFIQ